MTTSDRYKKDMLEHSQIPLQSGAQETALQAKNAAKLAPFLKWAGGKEQELRHILPAIPIFEHYYEPFVGGGAVFFSIATRRGFINDRSAELYNLYIAIAQQNPQFFQALDILLCSRQRISQIVDAEASMLIKIYTSYSAGTKSYEEMTKDICAFIASYAEEFISMFTKFLDRETDNFIQEVQKNLLNKTKRMKALESRKWQLSENDVLANIESAIKSAFYMHLRYLYNKTSVYALEPGIASAIFFYVRENAYAAMFRYNSRGEFNVPYGGISYNRKDLARKVNYMRSSRLHTYLNNTVIENMDFETFLNKYPPQKDDFVFLDPPYDSEFNTYAQNEFTMLDQERLAAYLQCECQAKFMLVIKNTPAIFKLYSQSKLTIKVFDKKYLVSFQDRNDKDVEHLMIMNY